MANGKKITCSVIAGTNLRQCLRSSRDEIAAVPINLSGKLEVQKDSADFAGGDGRNPGEFINGNWGGAQQFDQVTFYIV